MADPTKPPRPRPPPVPSLPLSKEPFPPADSERPPPLPQLDSTPAPDARRSNSTPPSGSLLLRHLAEQLSDDPREQLIRDQALTIKLYQQRVTELSRNATPSPVPAPPRSTAQLAGKVSLNIGKYTALATGILGLADVVVGLWFPEYLGPLGMVKRLLGAP